jgi:hypothetical protein
VVGPTVTGPARRDWRKVTNIVRQQRSPLGRRQRKQGLVVARDEVGALAHGDNVVFPLSESCRDGRRELLIEEQLQPSALCPRSQRSRSRAAASISAAA